MAKLNATWCVPGIALLSLFACVSNASSQDQTIESPEVRARIYAELEEDTQALARQLGLLKKVVRLVTPNVVHIEARKDAVANPRGRRPQEEAGSGIIVKFGDRFVVLTNRHVVKDASLTSIKVKLADDRELTPTQVWSDRGTDVAVLAISGSDLVPARIGNSDSLEIGDYVIAVGSPFGLSHSVTFGIISAKGRRDLKLGDDEVRYQNFMQTDAAINPGNSGGPLLNLRGEVVGINTAIASASGGNEGIGFTIPINMVVNVARQLVDRGRVVRAFLGVHLDSKFNPAMAAQLGLNRPVGAKVSGITPESPAEAAAIQVGDVILRFNSQRVEDDNHLVNLVSLTPVGKEVDILIWRNKKQKALKVRVGERGQFNQ